MVRCWEPGDATLFKEALDSSLDHLGPWLPWAAAEPQTLDEKLELLRRFRGNFDLGKDFVYGIFAADEREVVGGTGLHTRAGDRALEIGYWIRASQLRRGFAREVTAALTRVAFRICAVDRVEIRVDPANDASLAIPRQLGFAEEATLRRRLPSGGDGAARDAVVFSLFADELDRSPAAGAALAAFDALGRVVAV